MNEIHITGGTPLSGSITIQGSKNSALPMMAASLLHRGTSVLKGCPRIADVFCMEEILMSLGAVTRWEGHDLYLDCTHADGTEIPGTFTGKMRSSIILLGVLLARNKRGCIGYPGGCVIGKRPVDLHFLALKSLGARITEGDFFIYGECEKPEGRRIVFPKSSVGASEQAILGAVTAKGETILENCAREPEITWLCRYLRTMGAEMEGEGSPVIRIRGVEELGPGEMRIPPDRIVAGTYICAAAVTRGKITIENAPVEEMEAFLQVYQKIGGQYEGKSGKLKVNGKQVCNPVEFLETESYPGFPTDLQSPVLALLSTIPGRSHIREGIFEDRFRAAEGLRRMGAHIEVRGRDAFIEGGYPLTGACVSADELRGGAALVLAGAAAQGETWISGAGFIKRGYEHICEDLKALGCREIYEAPADRIKKDTGINIYERIQLP